MQKPQPQSHEKISKKDIHAGEIDAHLEHISHEFTEGFELLRKYPKSVTMFGSSLIQRETPIYKTAEELASRIIKETGYAVLTGGGPGLMEAFNKGAKEAGGQSVGLNESLPHDHAVNTYLTDHIKFSYFFTRKAMMAFTAEAYVFFPGGFGTFDELFSILTLIQTDKIPRVPVILFDSAYWNDVVTVIKGTMFEKFGTIKEKELGLFKVTDSPDEVIEIINKSPVSEWWKNLN